MLTYLLSFTICKLWLTVCRYKLSRRSEPAALASSPVRVILGPGVVSQSPVGRCSAQTVIVSARSVTQPLTGDNCTIVVDLVMVYQ